MSLLATKDLTVRFGGHVAVNGVTCAFQPGTLTAIVGPNGAGKTTYFNLISGQLRATAGQVTLDGRDLSGFSASQRTRAGLGRAFQLTNLFPRLTVLENVRLAVQAAHENRHQRGMNLWSVWSDQRELIARADEILAAVALGDKAKELVASLPHGDQRKLEVALLMGLQSRVFMFDEPTAGMNAAEAPVILNLIRKLKEDESKTILLVEHKMDVVRELADRIVVLHNGTLVADGDPATVIASPIVQEAYLGVSSGAVRAEPGEALRQAQGERAARQGERAARQGEQAARQGEQAARQGEQAARQGEQAARQGERAARRGEPPGRGRHE